GSEAIAQPASGKLEQSVGQAEGKRDPPHHYERDAKLLADHGPSGGENIPVHVRDHVRRDGHGQHDVPHTCRPLRGGWRRRLQRRLGIGGCQIAHLPRGSLDGGTMPFSRRYTAIVPYISLLWMLLKVRR